MPEERNVLSGLMQFLPVICLQTPFHFVCGCKLNDYTDISCNTKQGFLKSNYLDSHKMRFLSCCISSDLFTLLFKLLYALLSSNLHESSKHISYTSKIISIPFVK